jgi:long-chain fatty acid transport protein
LLVELSNATRIGLGYRSQIGHTLEGEFTRSDIGLVDTISADLTSPDQVTAGFYHDINEQIAVMAEVGWTNWSTFDEIRVVGDTFGVLSVTPEDWDNVWFGAIGATWKAKEDLKIRGGLAYDQSPVPDTTRTPRIPDADRIWLSLGANYSPAPNFSIDAGYTHIFVGDSTVSQTALGPFTANFENSVDIISVSGTLRF